MRLPNIQYQSKPSRSSQISFGGIDRNLISSDGSIYDMINISTHDFPVLTAVADRYVGDTIYEKVWHYGKAHKEYVVAGRVSPSDTRYKKWESGGTYEVGDQRADNGRIYVCTKSKNAGEEAPHVNSDCWEIDSSVMFEYNGDWDKNKTYSVGDIVYYFIADENGKDSYGYFVNVTGKNDKHPIPGNNLGDWHMYSYAEFYYTTDI